MMTVELQKEIQKLSELASKISKKSRDEILMEKIMLEDKIHERYEKEKRELEKKIQVRDQEKADLENQIKANEQEKA